MALVILVRYVGKHQKNVSVRIQSSPNNRKIIEVFVGFSGTRHRNPACRRESRQLLSDALPEYQEKPIIGDFHIYQLYYSCMETVLFSRGGVFSVSKKASSKSMLGP